MKALCWKQRSDEQSKNYMRLCMNDQRSKNLSNMEDFSEIAASHALLVMYLNQLGQQRRHSNLLFSFFVTFSSLCRQNKGRWHSS